MLPRRVHVLLRTPTSVVSIVESNSKPVSDSLDNVLCEAVVWVIPQAVLPCFPSQWRCASSQLLWYSDGGASAVVQCPEVGHVLVPGLQCTAMCTSCGPGPPCVHPWPCVPYFLFPPLQGFVLDNSIFFHHH